MLGLALAAHAAAAQEAVTTPGAGTLTKCRDWLVYLSCSTYHHIKVPDHVAIGDGLALTYGSNPKHYVFHVAQIRRQGNGCTLLSDRSGSGEEAERIDIAPCQLATTGDGGGR